MQLFEYLWLQNLLFKSPIMITSYVEIHKTIDYYAQQAGSANDILPVAKGMAHLI